MFLNSLCMIGILFLANMACVDGTERIYLNITGITMHVDNYLNMTLQVKDHFSHFPTFINESINLLRHKNYTLVLKKLRYDWGSINEYHGLVLLMHKNKTINFLESITGNSDESKAELMEIDYWKNYIDEISSSLKIYKNLIYRFLEYSRVEKESSPLLEDPPFSEAETLCKDLHLGIRPLIIKYDKILQSYCISKGLKTPTINDNRNHTNLCLTDIMLLKNEYRYPKAKQFMSIIMKDAAQLVYTSLFCSIAIYGGNEKSVELFLNETINVLVNGTLQFVYSDLYAKLNNTVQVAGEVAANMIKDMNISKHSEEEYNKANVKIYKAIKDIGLPMYNYSLVMTRVEPKFDYFEKCLPENCYMVNNVGYVYLWVFRYLNNKLNNTLDEDKKFNELYDKLVEAFYINHNDSLKVAYDKFDKIYNLSTNKIFQNTLFVRDCQDTEQAEVIFSIYGYNVTEIGVSNANMSYFNEREVAEYCDYLTVLTI